MGEAAMVGEAKHRTFEISQYIDIRRFRRQRHRGGSECRLPVEPGTGKAGSGKKVGNRFQSLLYSHVGQTLLSAALEFGIELNISWLGSRKKQSQRRRTRASVLHVLNR